MKEFFKYDIDLTEFQKLVDLMVEAKLPFEVKSLFGGKMLLFKNEECRICDAVIHSFSIGREQGWLEYCDNSKGKLEVEGNLSASEVFKRIKRLAKREASTTN